MRNNQVAFIHLKQVKTIPQIKIIFGLLILLFVHSLASEFNYDEDDSLYDDEEDEEDFYYDDARAGTIIVKYLNICGNKEYYHQRQIHTFDYNSETFVTGCKDRLPAKMRSDNNCKALEKTCSNLKNKCTSKLGSALGSSKLWRVRKCKTALGNDKDKKVQRFCKLACKKCGKLIEHLKVEFKIKN